MFALKTTVLLSALCTWIYGALEFTVQPSLVKAGEAYRVEFGLNEAADIEVAIVDTVSNRIIRHLAAGVLGANPPAPLVKDSLHQVLAWDGKNDMGVDAAAEALLGVRVRAGMSVKLDKMAGGNNYAFRTINGLTADKSGNIYVYGNSTTVKGYAVRQYDATGAYTKTIYPYPSDLATAQVSGFGVNNWLNGGYSPKMGPMRCNAQMTASLVANNGGNVSLLPLRMDNEIAFSNLVTIMYVGTDGSARETGGEVPFITSPALPSRYVWGGPAYVTLSQDGKWYYLSGFYHSSERGEPVAPTGVFWQDGQVIRINAQTGAAEPFIKMDSVPTTYAERQYVIGPVYNGYGANPNSAFHGAAIDDSGHIFVADRFHGRVSVYDTNGTFLGGVPVRFPDAVAVDKNTGAIYVTTRILNAYYTGYLDLLKFDNWRTPAAPVCSLRITTRIGQAMTDKSVVMTAERDGVRYVWLAYYSIGVQVFRDDGNALVKVRDFNAENPDPVLGFTRLAVDRATNTAFAQDSWNALTKCEDWSDPVFRPCSTSSGRRLLAQDVAVSPDRQLYVRDDGGAWGGSLSRFSMDHYHAPVAFANTDSNRMISWVYSKMGSGYGDRGFAVGYDKKVAVMYLYMWAQYLVNLFADSGTFGPSIGGQNDSTLRSDTLVTPVTDYGGGVQMDQQGNLYVGAMVRSTQHQVPAGWETDNAYRFSVGSVVRFPKDARGAMVPGQRYLIDETQVTGEDRVYLPGLGAFSGPGSDGDYCGCRSPRFEVDPYGRLFIPNAVTQRIAVVDNNDNPILTFGEYGNRDAAGPGIPFAFPGGVATSEDYIYVADEVNTRMVRVKMEYALENMRLPEAAADGGVDNYSPLQLIAAPNPFNPVTVIGFSAGRTGKTVLSVYDISGRLVKTLFSGNVRAGLNRVEFNAAGLPTGLYLARLEAKGGSLTKKISLIR